MKNIALALFVLWYLSLQFYIYVPGVLTVMLGTAFVSVSTVALLDWYSRRRAMSAPSVDRDGSLGL